MTYDVKINGFAGLDETSIDELLENFIKHNHCFEDCLSAKFSFNNLGKPYSCHVKFATLIDRDKCLETAINHPPSFINASGANTTLTISTF